MTIHWMSGIGSANERTRSGKAMLTAESNCDGDRAEAERCDGEGAVRV